MISVAIITFNEEDRLPLTLESVKDLADEIIIVDSGSTDGTLKIAENFGAKTFQNNWNGFSNQKNIALEKCTNDWVLSLDADEVLTKELLSEIKEVIANSSTYSYSINRKTYYLGKLLNNMWQPDYQLRLVNKKNNPRWNGNLVHEGIEVDCEIKKLKNHLIHYSYRDLNDHFTKMIKYAELASQELVKKEKKPSTIKLLINPIVKFKKQYFLKGGYKDGVPGLVASISSIIYTFMKYAYLFEKSREKN